MRKAPLILMALNCVVWGGLSWMGWGGIKSIEAQQASGYPNTGQIGYYLAAPLVMLTASLVPGALFGQTKWSAAATLWCTLTLLAVLPYLYPYGGGV